MDMPKEIFLKDYKLPDYYFDTMDLNFFCWVRRKQLSIQKRIVLPRIEGSPFPLVLDGVDLKLVSVKVNSKELKKEDYVLSSCHLTLPSLPSGEFAL
ncbi:hypothetical protein VitviT2T_024383 [Vitis vinifera]|uniref:Uncharacterized protein n=1 Tax=Vitis vinifera TaxID=29760 RepID=A0ABY9DFT4_VITVI|nr:hypothetical protein VitviT2T_024383 [Vitis vinifera]